MESIITHCVREGIKTNPAAAAREVPRILQAYITDIDRLNRVFQAVERVCLQPDNFNLQILRREIDRAKQAPAPTPLGAGRLSQEDPPS